MMKKSVLVSAFTGLCATTFLVSAATYSIVRMEEPKTIDLSAFRNAAANIQFVSSPKENQNAEAKYDVTASIVKSIENEVRAKILRTRFAITSAPKKREISTEAIAKNWNDIRPTFAAVDFKIEEPVISKIEMENKVSEFEINNKELIKLYGYEVDQLSYATFSSVEIASIEDSTDLKSDEVQVAQASTSTQLVEEIVPEPELAKVAETAELKEATELTEVADTTNGEDLVVYDYSKPNSLPKKMFDAPISNSVKEAIAREVHKSPTIASNVSTQKRNISANTTTNESELEKAMNDEDNLVFDYSDHSQSSLKKNDEAKSIASAFAATESEKATQVEFTIKASEVNLNTQKVKQLYGYEFVPDYDRSERSDDQTSGEIKIGYSLAGDVATQTGVVQSLGLIPTRVELNLLNKGMNIPLLNEEGIQKFLIKKGTDVAGNLLMIAVDPSIIDVEIDSESQYKLFFSSKFKLLESQENAAYVLFMGIKSGNISLRYLLSNKESAQKIIYVGDGEMYFEDPDFIDSTREQYTLTTRSLLGKKVKELNIDGDNITFFGAKTAAKKKALNVYEIKVPELVNNSRKYLEFKHMDTSLFVGTSSTKQIEIPGKDFIGRVLEANDLSSIGERCLVQVNLTKDLRDIKVSGKNKTGEMFAETSFLDSEGNFTRDSSELAEKVFITGDLEGIFNVRLDYTDGTTDFLKTFCSEGSYLIEQL